MVGQRIDSQDVDKLSSLGLCEVECGALITKLIEALLEVKAHLRESRINVTSDFTSRFWSVLLDGSKVFRNVPEPMRVRHRSNDHRY